MKNLFYLIIFIAIVSGCTKNDAGKNLQNTDGSTTLLASSVVLGSSLSITDTFSVSKFHYDSQHRLILITNLIKPSGHLDSDALYYDNTGNLVKTTYQFENEPGKPKVNGHSDFTYSNNIPVSVYDVNDVTPARLFTYQVANNKVVGFTLSQPSGTLTKSNGTITYDGDNIKSVTINDIENNLTASVSTTTEYDDQKGFFFNNGSKWFLPGGEAGLPLIHQNLPVSTTMVETVPYIKDPVTTLETYTYQFNNAGYATKLSATVNGAVFSITYYSYASFK